MQEVDGEKEMDRVKIIIFLHFISYESSVSIKCRIWVFFFFFENFPSFPLDQIP